MRAFRGEPVTAISSVVGINFVSSNTDRFFPLAVVVVVMVALSLVLLRWTKKQGWW